MPENNPMPVRTSKKPMLTVRMLPAQYAQLSAAAKQRNVSLNTWCLTHLLAAAAQEAVNAMETDNGTS